ncbi:hypothetical protein BaRGS_00038077, partial [Batillaria attramentaria]
NGGLCIYRLRLIPCAAGLKAGVDTGQFRHLLTIRNAQCVLQFRRGLGKHTSGPYMDSARSLQALHAIVRPSPLLAQPRYKRSRGSQEAEEDCLVRAEANQALEVLLTTRCAVNLNPVPADPTGGRTDSVLHEARLPIGPSHRVQKV